MDHTQQQNMLQQEEILQQADVINTDERSRQEEGSDDNQSVQYSPVNQQVVIDDSYTPEDEEEDYVSDDEYETSYQDQRLSEEQSPGFQSALTGVLANIPEDQELDQDIMQMPSYKIQTTPSDTPISTGNISPMRSNPLGPSLEVMNLELETALQDAEQEILNLQEKLKSKELQLEQVQIALLTYEEELSNKFHPPTDSDEDKCNMDVFQKTMAKSLQLLEEQKNRELKDIHKRLDERNEIIIRLQEERDLMARDSREMQISYENQLERMAGEMQMQYESKLERMARSKQQLAVQQDASEYEIGELLKRFKSAERERDALEMKLYEAMNQINALSGDDAVQCLYNQVQELQQANSRLTEDLKRALRMQGRTPFVRNQEQESRLKGMSTPSQRESRPTTPSSITNSSAVMRPITPLASSVRPITPFGDGAVLYGTVARQLMELHETTDNLMQLNTDVQQQLALCQAIDANAERSLSSAFRALRYIGNDSPLSDASTHSSISEPVVEGTQSLQDLQDFVREIRDNLSKAVGTLDILSQEKSHLHSRIRILEACLKASGADQFVSHNTNESSSNPNAVYGGVEQPNSEAATKKLLPPKCENYEEAIEKLEKVYEELECKQIETSRMEREQTELVEMVEKLENELQGMRREREILSRRHTYTSGETINRTESNRSPSVNSNDSADAIQVAEEMSRKLVRIQQEKEDMEDKFVEQKLENAQLKEVRMQLENQIQLLLQQQKRSQGGGLRSIIRSDSWGKRK